MSSTQKVKRQRPHMFTLHIGKSDQRGYRRYRVPYSFGENRIVLTRNELDVMKGEPGFVGACANAMCIIRSVGESEVKFPHDVYEIQFERTRVFIIDRRKKDGTPTHAVVYKHNQYDFIIKYDDPQRSKAYLLKNGEAKGDVILKPYSKSARNRVRLDNRGGPHKTTKPTSYRGFRGAHARLNAAGLLDQPPRSEGPS